MGELNMVKLLGLSITNLEPRIPYQPLFQHLHPMRYQEAMYIEGDDVWRTINIFGCRLVVEKRGVVGKGY
jgi:hypothetical protein